MEYDGQIRTCAYTDIGAAFLDKSTNSCKAIGLKSLCYLKRIAAWKNETIEM